MTPRTLSTPYIEWAKRHQGATYNLALSGMPHAAFDDIGGVPADMPISSSNGYGYPPLLEAIARKHGVAANQVVTCTGCSMANYLALAALIGPGDEVLLERPTYEPLLRVAEHLGATIRRFERPPSEDCAVSAARVIDAITAQTRVIVLANLHNPSAQLVGNDVLRAIGEAAAKVGARVLVDEVYLDAVFDGTPPSAIHLGAVFLTTNSLTKVYGLSALRCGWITADADFVARAWRLADLYGNVQPFAPEWLACRAFDYLPALRDRARHLLTENRALLNEWLQSRSDITAIAPPYGTTVCVRPHSMEATRLCERLRRDYDVSVVPGHFFEMPDYVRIGLTQAPALFREGLTRIGECLDDSR
jgi:aspartate/methionine/tyrosine aminotransferase